ncbi:MAG TPA: hypothetical protein VFG53_03360 [Anaeromyxobacter sp.]|nr:hypothetical protein [Anaeromyxobacter sp.]
MTASHLVLIALLSGPPESVQALHEELDAVAARIEELKARRLAGEAVEGELEPLLVRSQELAAELEQGEPAPAPSPSATVPPPVRARLDELRGRASFLRREADRLSGNLSALEITIAAALKSIAQPPSARREDPESPSGLPGARPTVALSGGPISSPVLSRDAIASLVNERRLLQARILALLAEAALLDAAADALERAGAE